MDLFRQLQRWFRCGAWLVGLASLAVAPSLVCANGAVVTMNLGQYVFHIPEKNSMEGQAPFWLKTIPGLDDDVRSASIVFRVDDLRRAIPGFSGTVDLFATLSVLSEIEIARQYDPSFYHDMWYLSGGFKDAKIEPLGQKGFVRIYRKGARNMWRILRQRPSPTKLIPTEEQKFWIASCSTGAPGKPASCNSSYFFNNDLLVEFHFSEDDVGRIDSIREYIRASVLSWVQPKGGAHKERQL